MFLKSVKLSAGLVAMATAIAASGSASAAIVKISAGNFNAQAGVITFDNYGAQNPTYTPADYGANPATAPTVTTGGFYVGQSLSGNPGTDCPGAAASACVVGSPSGPTLALDPNSPAVIVTGDGAQPTSPILSGSPTFNGPISVIFSVDQLAVGFDGGYFNAVGSTAIKAYDRQGNFLGQVVNGQEGVEFLGLATDDGIARIAGVSLALVGAEPAGFDIDNLRFGVRGQVVIPSAAPEPASWAMMIGGFGLIGGALRRRAKTSVAFA